MEQTLRTIPITPIYLINQEVVITDARTLANHVLVMQDHQWGIEERISSFLNEPTYELWFTNKFGEEHALSYSFDSFERAWLYTIEESFRIMDSLDDNPYHTVDSLDMLIKGFEDGGYDAEEFKFWRNLLLEAKNKK